MGIESPFTGKYISDLVATNPVGGSDPKSEGDDHIRGIKLVLQNTFSAVTGEVTASHTELNYNDITTLGTAQTSKTLTLDSNGDLDMNNVGRIDNCETVQFFVEVDNGNAGSADTIVLNAGQKQKSTLNAATVTLTLTEPASVGNWVLKLVGTSGSSPTITWATTGAANVYWAGGAQPTWSNDGTDIVSIYYDGTNLYCAAVIGFA